MPKGVPGCFTCGEKTACVVQVWVRDYAGSSSKTVSIDSVSRRFCRPCAEEAYAIASRVCSRPPRIHGCARCGEPSDTSLKAWLRDLDGRSLASSSASFCEPCGDLAYGDALERLAGDWTQ